MLRDALLSETVLYVITHVMSMSFSLSCTDKVHSDIYWTTCSDLEQSIWYIPSVYRKYI